ncbi:restriction endonuclease subunit S [Acinetobacter sp. VNK23]|uniref:restriction endonuclease subunit S n=1 Tax=Acinetobacter thutiue TaxID=2998078 RepID=UPI00257866B8|nr:restriction endonuclease subunit S [Acinetobacter thutiue]MDM1020430.1 restriction endonuclease subunit S [Acinetobacter thutiue]
MSELKIPQGYKQTEVGVIPEDWGVYSLPDVIWYQEGPGLRNWQFKSKGLKVINVTNLQENGWLDLDKTDRHISWSEFEKTYKHFACDNGDLVIASSGNSYCKASIVRECDLPLLMNTSVIRFKPIGIFSKGYMEVYLKSQYFKNQIDLLITGGAQPNFGPAHLNQIKIPAPIEEKEQTAIATALSDTDALISELEKLISKKQAIKTATMQQLLTGKTRLPQFSLRADGSKKGYKQSELGEIPEDWEVYLLSLICDVRDGTHDSPKYKDNGIPLVTSKNIVDDILDLSNVSLISPEDAFKIDKRSKVDKGDIIMSMIGTVGSAVLLLEDPEFCIKNVALFKPKKVLGEFLVQLIRSKNFQDYLEGSMDGGIQKFVSLGTLRNMEISLPSEQEQIAIATILSDMDSEIQALEQRLVKTRQIKQGMMQELLTGKTRLVQPEARGV